MGVSLAKVSEQYFDFTWLILPKQGCNKEQFCHITIQIT